MNNIVLPCIAGILIGSALTLWHQQDQPTEQPVVTLPPLVFERQGSDLLVWGSWATEYGYREPGRNAVEIRCYREQGVCTESVGNVHHHDAGVDVEAQSYLYTISEWSGDQLQAVATAAMAGCVDRKLTLRPGASAGEVEWSPAHGCDGNAGLAMLIGNE